MKKYIKAGYNLDPTGEIQKAWDILELNGISYETLHIITSINGYSVDTLNDVARAAFGEDIEDLNPQKLLED